MANNYVLGRGKVYFDKFLPGTTTNTGERYLGNTPSLAMNSAYQQLDHYSSEEGVRIKDDTVQLQLDRSGTLTVDNISMENVALMFGTSDPETVTQGSDSGLSETFVVHPGLFYQLGTDDDNPDGVRSVANVVITDNSGFHASGSINITGAPAADETVTINGHAITFKTSGATGPQVNIGANAVATAQSLKAVINAAPGTYLVTASGDNDTLLLTALATGTGGNSITLTESAANLTVSGGGTLTGGSASAVISPGANVVIDLARGRFQVKEDAADLADGDSIEVVYDLTASTRTQVVDENDSAEGAMRFIAANAKGTNKDYFWPRVRLTPNGEFALKGDTWQQIGFNFDVLVKDDLRRVYVSSPAA